MKTFVNILILLALTIMLSLLMKILMSRFWYAWKSKTLIKQKRNIRTTVQKP